MLDHVGINCSDLPAAAAFYDKALGALGFTRLMDFGEAIGYGTDKPDFWLGRQPAEGPASGPNREIHVAFVARDAAAVRAFFDAATSLGAEVLHEPQFWPEYHKAYYARSSATPTATTSRRSATPRSRATTCRRADRA
jgi:catechol 2,3-dioxygenase-like lactoylglutathione lyase family enzyme